MNDTDYVPIIAAVVSGLAAIGAIVSGRYARRSAETANVAALDAQNEANRITSETNSLQALDWTSQYFEGVRQWANEVAFAMTEAMHLSRIQNSEERLREWNRIRARLSTSIDTGRWYFPNKYHTDYGIEKHLAYRGIRRRVLDHVTNAYNALPKSPEVFEPGAKNDPYTMDAFGKLEDSKRAFVSDCLLYTSPSPRDATLSRMPSSA